MKHPLPISTLILVLLSANAYCQQLHITGTVVDYRDNPVSGASVIVKGTMRGTVTNASGRFELSTTQEPPITIIVSMLGFQKHQQEISGPTENLQIQLIESTEMMDEVVFSASRVEENILQSPVTIEKLDLLDIQHTPSLSFYDALENMKGVEMVTSGLTFKQINTRGFNHTGNSRFLQLVDGVDNQTPGLGFAVGNMFGSTDLDMESAELIPGAASALYGPVAFNGVLMMKTKDPFQYQGLSVQTKVGLNHIGEEYEHPHLLHDYAIRYAKAFDDRFACKLNASYFAGLDFYATNYTDVDPGTPPAQRGDNNPARNALNIYGDDEARTIDGVGRVSRTGYEERDLTDYDVYSLKLNGALHYRVGENMELSYQYNFGKGTANYTGSNRFSINNFTLQQHKIELKGANYFIRAYSTTEDSHDSYNAKGLGQLINNTWVRDFDGNIVPEAQADDMWFSRYAEAYLGNIPGIAAGNHTAARAFADEGRFLPGSPEFNAQKERLIATQGLSGAGIMSLSTLYHAEGQYDFSTRLKFIDLLVGGNFRRYDMFTNGTLFDDKGGTIIIDEGGAFIQLGKKILNEKLRLSGSVRYDKNQNFKGRLTPRASAVFAVSDNHHVRTSFQTGFRNPTPGDQYIKLNAGPITILGGVPDNSRDMTVYQNSFTTASLGPFFGAFEQAMMQGATPQEAIMQAKDMLEKSNVEYIKPERVKVFEIGYKGVFSNNLVLDINYHFSSYTDFLLNTVVMEPQSSVLASDGSINPQAAMDLLNGDSHLYQLYTNASDVVTAQGATLGLKYALPHHFSAGVNATLATFDMRDADPNNIPGFNTPKYKTTVMFGNSRVTDEIGFNLVWRWQGAYDWYGTFNQMRPGRIEAFSVVDAQVSYKLFPIKSMIRLGANNLFNNQVYQAFGSPSIGAIYYVSLLFDPMIR